MNLREVKASRMLSHDNGTGVKDGVLGEKPEDCFIARLVVIRGVEEHQIQAHGVLDEASEERHRPCRLNLCLLVDLEPVEVVAQRLKRFFGDFGKVDLPSSAAQRLNPNGAGTGKQIGEDGILNLGGDDVE